MGFVVRDAQGKVIQSSPDLKSYVGQTISESQAKQITVNPNVSTRNVTVQDLQPDVSGFQKAALAQGLMNSQGVVNADKIGEYRQLYDEMVLQPNNAQSLLRNKIGTPVVIKPQGVNESNADYARRLSAASSQSFNQSAQSVANILGRKYKQPVNVSISGEDTAYNALQNSIWQRSKNIMQNGGVYDFGTGKVILRPQPPTIQNQSLMSVNPSLSSQAQSEQNPANWFNNANQQVSNFLFQDSGNLYRINDFGKISYAPVKKLRTPDFLKNIFPSFMQMNPDSNVRIIYNRDALTYGVTKQFTDYPIDTAAIFAGALAGKIAISEAKLGLTVLGKYIPAVREAYGFVSGAEKVVSIGGAAIYGGVAAYNVASAQSPVQQIGQEFVKFSALSAGISVGNKLMFRTDYLTQFEQNFQQLPEPKQTQMRTQFDILKSQLSDIGKGAVKPQGVDFSQVENLQKGNAPQLVRDFLSQVNDRIVIGGSLSSRGQTQFPNVLNPSGDVDVYTNQPGMSKDLAAYLRAGGVPANARGNKVFIEGIGKAVEFQALDAGGREIIGSKQSLQENIQTVANPLRNWMNSVLIGNDQFMVTDIRVQAARKLFGGFEFSADALGRVSSYRYSKDIPAYQDLLVATRQNNILVSAGNMDVQGFASSKFFALSQNGVLNPESLAQNFDFVKSFGGSGGSNSKSNYYLDYSQYSQYSFNSAYPSYKQPKLSPSIPYPNYKENNPQSSPVFPYPNKSPNRNIVTDFFLNQPNKRSSYGGGNYNPPISPVPSPVKNPVPYPNIPQRRIYGFDEVSKALKPSKQERKVLPIKSYLVGFAPKYFSSVEANALNIRGKKPSKRALSLGLGLRPILEAM